MIKITLANGNTVELNSIDEITAAIPALPILMGGSVTITDTIALPVEHEIIGEEDEEASDLLREQPTLIAPRRRGRRRRTPNPPEPHGRWPEVIYLTEAWNEVYQLIKAYPEGLTSEELGVGMGMLTDIASGRAMRLREATPLIKMDGNLHRLTQIGADDTLMVAIHHNPGRHNKELGWERFMALPLRAGKRKRRR